MVSILAAQELVFDHDRQGPPLLPRIFSFGMSTVHAAAPRASNAMSWLWAGIRALSGVLGDVAIAGVYAAGMILLGMSLWNRLAPDTRSTVGTLPRRLQVT